MNQTKILSRSAAFALLVVFSFTNYVALYDTTLRQLSPLHHSLNWFITAISLIAALLLIFRPASKLWVSLSGIVWPIIYIASLFLDVETLLCLGTNFSCWPSVTDAYDYLILGSRVEGWVLWPYTMRVVITFLVLVVILSALSIALDGRILRPKSWKVNDKLAEGSPDN